MTISVDWANWAANQVCSPRSLETPADVESVQDIVASAARAGRHVRVVGAGHSFSPLVVTDDVLLDVRGLTGIVRADAATARATMWAGTTIKDIGAPLWECGLALTNQGDIDTQTLAGAVSTSTHGSGRRSTSFSGALRSLEYVAADGELRRIDQSDPSFDAFRTSLGALGIFVELELQVAPAYLLHEQIRYWPLAEVLERWETESRRRHFSFFWGPRPGSLELYGFQPAPEDMAEGCFVKLYDEAPPDSPSPTLGNGDRFAPAWQVYPGDFDEPFHELEYFVPFDAALASINAVKRVILAHHDQSFPLEIRTIAADTAWLSPMYETDSISISVSGSPGTDYWPFFRAVDAALREFGGRPHWGKLHCVDRDRFERLYPRFTDFVELRRTLDPDGVFLNDHLAAIVG